MIDASALIEMLLRTSRSDALMTRILSANQRTHAPQLLDLEVIQVLRRLVQRKQITVGRAGQARDDLANLAIERHDHRPLVDRIWQLRDSLSACDAAYVALAEALDAPLITCDAKLAGARGHRVTIELIAD